MYTIKTNNLDIAYDKNMVVKDLDLKIEEGKITSIIGANGCGKSTILKSLGRILKPVEGEILLDNLHIQSMSTKDIAKKMAILPQTPTAPSGLTVEELVSYGRFPHQKGFGNLSKEDKEIVAWALSETKLSDLALRELDTLSGGQRQRVWIAMALAQQTNIILLDEPTTYLDLTHQLEVLTLLKDLNKKQQCTIIMVLHDLNLASRFSDEVIAIKDGEIVKSGTPQDVITKTVLREVFEIDAIIVPEPETNKPLCLTYNKL